MTDDTRKRTIYAGVIVGAVSVGLVVLLRKTPRDQWGETLRRVAGDAVAYVKERYGASEPIALVEKTLEKLGEKADESPIAHAFKEAVEGAPHRV